MFQRFQNSSCFFFSSINTVGDFNSFEFYENLMKKVAKYGMSQKQRHKLEKVHKQNVYQVEFYICSPKIYKIGPQTKKFVLRS